LTVSPCRPADVGGAISSVDKPERGSFDRARLSGKGAAL
jgi:hypothetical protein